MKRNIDCLQIEEKHDVQDLFTFCAEDKIICHITAVSDG